MNVMELYYNNDRNCFSLTDEGNSKKVFETHNREGWGNKETIEEGHFKLVINSNLYPKSPQNEFLRANLYLDGVQLLPVSQSVKITKSSISIGLQRIALNQYGSGKDKGKKPWTYFSRDLDWGEMLDFICKVSEQPEEWQSKEFRLLLELLKQKQSFENSPFLVGNLIKLFFPYEKMLVSSLYPMIRTNSLAAMRVLLASIEDTDISKLSSNTLEYGDLIWECIKYNSKPYNQLT